jgi:hypothetical protein
VPAAVCGGARDSVRTVMRAAVCGSVLGSVWQCARYSVRLSSSAAVCGSARGSVWQCARQCVAVRAAVCGSARGCVWQCARQCVAVRSTYYYAHSRSQYILVCPYRGSGGEPHTPHILIRTNRSI